MGSGWSYKMWRLVTSVGGGRDTNVTSRNFDYSVSRTKFHYIYWSSPYFFSIELFCKHMYALYVLRNLRTSSSGMWFKTNWRLFHSGRPRIIFFQVYSLFSVVRIVSRQPLTWSLGDDDFSLTSLPSSPIEQSCLHATNSFSRNFTSKAISKSLKCKRGKWGRHLWRHFYMAGRGAQYCNNMWPGWPGGGPEKIKSMVTSLMDSP